MNKVEIKEENFDLFYRAENLKKNERDFIDFFLELVNEYPNLNMSCDISERHWFIKVEEKKFYKERRKLKGWIIFLMILFSMVLIWAHVFIFFTSNSPRCNWYRNPNNIWECNYTNHVVFFCEYTSRKIDIEKETNFKIFLKPKHFSNEVREKIANSENKG